MDRSVFNKFRNLVFESSGISLSEQKEALVSARIGKRMRTLSIHDYSDYYQLVISDKSGQELKELLNAISTNVTQFFREKRHFDVMDKLLSDWSKKGKKKVRIWCAACSTGEEPYTLAMTALDSKNKDMTFQIIASDISTKVLQIAKFGVYRDSDVEGVEKGLLKKHFERGVGKAERLFRVNKSLKQFVSFHQINLSTPPYPIESGLDIIFCRNVMIYFDQELRRVLVENFVKMLNPGGYLFVGMAESLSGLQSSLMRVEPSVYIRKT